MAFRILLTVVTIATLSVFCSLAATEEFRNNTGEDVYGIRVTFSKRVEITDHGNEFPDVQPSGKAREFTFSDGTLRKRRTFVVSWEPSARVLRHEWITSATESQLDLSQTCDYSISPEYFDVEETIYKAWDGAVVGLQPGSYVIDWIDIPRTDITLRGLGETPSEVVITGSKYELTGFAVSSESTLVLENLQLDGPHVSSHKTGHLVLRGVIVGQVTAFHESSIEIEDSTLTYLEKYSRHVTVKHGTHVVIRSCIIESIVHVEEDATLIIFDSEFRGPHAGVYSTGNAHVEISRCAFDQTGSAGIRLEGFTGTVLGEGNAISFGEVYPSVYAYDWPEGFFSNSTINP